MKDGIDIKKNNIDKTIISEFIQKLDCIFKVSSVKKKIHDKVESSSNQQNLQYSDNLLFKALMGIIEIATDHKEDRDSNPTYGTDINGLVICMDENNHQCTNDS